ncbi:MAG: hypothetical protein SFU25_03620 [Candidatus Caenarcaniphilales bacterium]|nr:hypothetical protein [Candidatus Caenarcaniphilales bacterium]
MVGAVKLVLNSHRHFLQKGKTQSQVLRLPRAHGGVTTRSPLLGGFIVDPTETLVLEFDPHCIREPKFTADGPTCPRLEDERNWLCCTLGFPSIFDYRRDGLFNRKAPSQELNREFHEKLFNSIKNELAIYFENTEWVILDRPPVLLGNFRIPQKEITEFYGEGVHIPLEKATPDFLVADDSSMYFNSPVYEFELKCCGRADKESTVDVHYVKAKVYMSAYGDQSGNRKLTIEIIKDQQE